MTQIEIREVPSAIAFIRNIPLGEFFLYGEKDLVYMRLPNGGFPGVVDASDDENERVIAYDFRLKTYTIFTPTTEVRTVFAKSILHKQALYY
jgi:hypothetical protein